MSPKRSPERTRAAGEDLVVVTTRIDPSLHITARFLAEAQGTSLSELIRKAVEKMVSREMTPEGFNEIQQGLDEQHAANMARFDELRKSITKLGLSQQGSRGSS